MSEGSRLSAATPTTIAAAASPKIIRRWPHVTDLVGELFGEHHQHWTGYLLQQANGLGQAVGPGRARGHQVQRECVWYMPNSADSQVATEGIIRVLVQEQNTTAPISWGSRPECRKASRAACRAMSSRLRSV